MGNYDDIINLPHHISKKHPRLSIEQRAAQFAPFAALTGYDEKVKETARLTEEKVIINNKLQKIKNNITNKPKATITYFVPDLKKPGGKYVTVIDNVKKIDEYKHCLIMCSQVEIPINEIIEILI